MNPKIKIVRQQAVAMLNMALLLTIGPDAPPPAAMSPDQLYPVVAPIARCLTFGVHSMPSVNLRYIRTAREIPA